MALVAMAAETTRVEDPAAEAHAEPKINPVPDVRSVAVIPATIGIDYATDVIAPGNQHTLSKVD